MGLQLPKRAAAPARRVSAAVVLVATLLLVSACSADDQAQIKRLAMPAPITEQAPYTFELWKYFWLVAMIVGGIVWGLIIFVIIRYRRRHDAEVPVQMRYHLPLEIFYTIAPIMMVVVLFYWTVDVQNKIIAMDPDPDVTVDVVGQQWSWTFNYTGQGEGGDTPYTAGTASQIPTLVLPVDQNVQFNLHSPDVIHSFSIEGFLMKLDVVPGRINKFQATPTVIGEYRGKCFELCGTYHSRMLFNVEVVSQADYADYLDELAAQGNVADEPLLGGARSTTQTGLAEDQFEEGANE